MSDFLNTRLQMFHVLIITVAEYLWKGGVGLTETVSVVAINK